MVTYLDTETIQMIVCKEYFNKNNQIVLLLSCPHKLSSEIYMWQVEITGCYLIHMA